MAGQAPTAKQNKGMATGRIRAGYSKKTASEQGSRLLENVKVAAAIAKGKDARSERIQVTADMVVAKMGAKRAADDQTVH